MNTPTARPTEYRNVTFRSKSEAIMARCFDLAEWLWKYEPGEFLSDADWVPDFKLAVPSHSGENHPGFLLFIAEYKPCRPTDCYLIESATRFRSVLQGRPEVGTIVIFGSAFNSERRGILHLTEDGWLDSDGLICLFDGLEEARGYRFDLLHA